jgi:hypothetical protein
MVVLGKTVVHGAAMTRSGKADATIQVAETSDGLLTYLVADTPEALPPVLARDLERAWHQAREAAIAAKDGPARLFRFTNGRETVADLALIDTDARCWAAAVDATRGLGNLAGLSVCLRLLALVELMTRARWTAAHVTIRRDGAEIGAALLRAAATTPLTREANFDEHSLQARVAHCCITHDTPSSVPGAHA